MSVLDPALDPLALATDSQRRATTPGHSAWVEANAGTGKTKVLTDRVTRLLLDRVKPERILCLTFTKAAAAEMRNRLAGQLGRWAMATEAELDEAIERLIDRKPEPADRIVARRLFARVLDAPGERIDGAIRTVRLEGQTDQIVGTLSGGERSRVSLATALLGEPELLVLDEPTVGLDPVLRRDLWATFHELAAEGTTLLVSSHVMDEADRCHDLVLLRDGRVLATGSPDDLRRRTGQDDLEEAFLALAEES